MKNLILKYDRIFVGIWGVLLFVPFLGSVHLFDWDEVNFAESAREMLLSGNYQKVQINFQPFMEKPPLFFWLQALSMQIFGINEFAARFPNALVGIITLLLVFTIGKKHFGQSFAFFWVLFITGSLTPHLYFKSGIIDPLYNLFIFSAIYQLYLYTIEATVKRAWFLGLFIGLAIITKGPVAVVVVVLCFLVLWAIKKFQLFFKWMHLVQAMFAALLVSSTWFGVETIQSGPKFLLEFINYQADLFLNPVAGHGQPFWYHPLVLLLGCFPASILALPILFERKKISADFSSQGLVTIMRLFFWVVLILFSIVETKIVHYSSLCYLPLTFMAAHFVRKWQQASIKWSSLQSVLFGVIGFIISILLTLISLTDKLKQDIIPYIKDDFAVASLKNSGNWHLFDLFFGLAFLGSCLFAGYHFYRGNIFRGAQRYLLVSSVLIPIMLIGLAPHIEQYSQAPAITFFESLQGKDVYVETLGYKSYAQYFYTQSPMHRNPNYADVHWLQTGPIDKDAYFSLQCNDIADHINSSMQEIGRSGGFVFYKRSAVIKP